MTPEELQDCIDKNQAIIDTSEDAAMVDQAKRHNAQLLQEIDATKQIALAEYPEPVAVHATVQISRDESSSGDTEKP